MLREAVLDQVEVSDKDPAHIILDELSGRQVKDAVDAIYRYKFISRCLGKFFLLFCSPEKDKF